MSTIQSSAEHLTLNADGASKDIKFQANGVEKASISSAGAFTSTTIDATKLTGNLPAISGANLTGVGVAGITSTADATAITIDSSENVGIGTSPSYKLHTLIGAGEASGVGILNTSGQGLNIYTDSTAANADVSIDQGATGAATIFRQNGTERMRMDSAGRLLIGTTSANIVNNSGLRVRADSYGQYAAQIAHRKDNGDAYGLDIDIENYTGTAGQIMIQFQTSGGAMGNIKATQNSVQYNSNSDYRLKENVDYTWDATTRLKQLKPARFNFKNDDTNTLVDGFLAHEVSSVVPNAVTGEKDATKTYSNVVLKANGRLQDFNVTEAEWTAGKLADEYDSDSTWVASHTQDVNQEMDNSKLVPLLVKTIQELEARIAALEA